MGRPKFTKAQLELVVKESSSFKEAYEKISNSSNSSSGYQNFRKRIIENKIDTSHFATPNSLMGKPNKLRWEEILVYNRRKRNVREASYRLRKAMLESGIPWRCNDCGNKGTWNDLPMMLEIDHIDNDPLNNCKDNLRFLCPNCHSLYSNSKNWREISLDKNGLFTTRK